VGTENGTPLEGQRKAAPDRDLDKFDLDV